MGIFWISDFLDDQSDHFAWEVKFSSGSTEDFSCFYTKINISFPLKNGCINIANMAVIFHGSTWLLKMAQTFPHCFLADFRVVPLGRREAWQATEPQGTKNMIQSDHLPSRDQVHIPPIGKGISSTQMYLLEGRVTKK